MAPTEHLPPQPRQAQLSSVLAVIGMTLLAAGLVTGIVLAAGSLDPRELTRTSAWLFPLLVTGIGALLSAVILRFAAVLGALRLRMDAMRIRLPQLIDDPRGH